MLLMSRNPYKNPNPQGKGLVPVLADWSSSRPRAVSVKESCDLLFDWFASALVLSAEFKFKPAPGQRYYLYARDGGWQLSLVGPGEWGDRKVGDCLGSCELAFDMTWSISADPALGNKPELQQRLAALAEAFLASLDTEQTLEDVLPGYRRDLPYYQRMLATGLGASLRQSVGPDLHLQQPARELLRGGEQQFLRLLDLA